MTEPGGSQAGTPTPSGMEPSSPKPPSQPTTTPQFTAPPPAQPPASSGWQAGQDPGAGSGCAKLALILLVLAVAVVIGLALFAGNFVNNLAPGAGLGNGDAFLGSDDCPFLSDAEAQAVLGGQADAIELAGFYDASIGIFIDKRVLPEAPDCFVTEGQRAYLARIAVSDGDGAGVFAAERERAAPSSQDQGGGVSVENAGYFGSDVSGLGDEAFCTGVSDAIMGGVLVRQGDRVVYVSVGSAAEGQSVPDMNTTPEGVVTSPSLCDLAQELARSVLE